MKPSGSFDWDALVLETDSISYRRLEKILGVFLDDIDAKFITKVMAVVVAKDMALAITGERQRFVA